MYIASYLMTRVENLHNDTAFLRFFTPHSPIFTNCDYSECVSAYFLEHAQGVAVLNTTYRVLDYLMCGPVAMLTYP